jgi:hypothetical protein
MNDCPMSAPICDTGSCRGCAIDSECASNICDVDTGTCVADTSVRYADPNGQVANDCSSAAPCTLAKALSIIDIQHPWLRMLPGVYANASITIGNESIRIVGTGATLIPPTGTQNTGVVLTTGANASIRGLVVGSAGNLVQAFQCAPPSGTANVVLRNVSGLTAGAAALVVALDVEKLCTAKIEESNFVGLVQFADGSSSVVDRSRFSGSWTVSGTSSLQLQVSNTTFVEPTLAPSLSSTAPPGSFKLYFAYNTFYSTDTSFAAFCGANGPAGTNLTFIDNIFYAPSSMNAFSATSGCTADTNVVYPHASAANPGSNPITLDPKLVDAANGDFHLQPSSPAIDMAKPTANDPPVDIDGTTRPQGAAYDIGAYEYKP